MMVDTSTTEPPKNPADQRGWIIWQLHRRGWSLTRIALQEGVSLQAVSAALVRPSSHLQRTIARVLNLDPQHLFPETFAPDGRRLGKTRRMNRSTRPGGRNVEEGVAA